MFKYCKIVALALFISNALGADSPAPPKENVFEAKPLGVKLSIKMVGPYTEAADLQIVDLGHDAVVGRPHRHIRQIEPRAVELGPRGANRRMVIDINVRIAAQPNDGTGDLLLDRRDMLTGHFEIGLGALVSCPGVHLAMLLAAQMIGLAEMPKPELREDLAARGHRLRLQRLERRGGKQLGHGLSGPAFLQHHDAVDAVGHQQLVARAEHAFAFDPGDHGVTDIVPVGNRRTWKRDWSQGTRACVRSPGDDLQSAPAHVDLVHPERVA